MGYKDSTNVTLLLLRLRMATKLKLKDIIEILKKDDPEKLVNRVDIRYDNGDRLKVIRDEVVGPKPLPPQEP